MIVTSIHNRLATLLAIGCFSFTGLTAHAQPSRIMLVGDSFWDMQPSRQGIYNNLTAANVSFDFVGSEGRGTGPAGNFSTVTDPDHEGISSKQLNHILDGRTDYQPRANTPLVDLLPVFNPDVVGVQAGINDVLFNFIPKLPILPDSSGRTVEQMLGDITTIAQTIHDHDVSTHVIFTTLTPVAPSSIISSTAAAGINAQVLDYNEQLETLVADLADQGRNVSLVDSFAAWGGTTSGNIVSDGLHPNTLGHQRLADAWTAGIEAALVPEPNSLALLGLGALVMTRRRRG